MILYHGSREIVKYPEIRKAQYHKDFYFGFYCTKFPNQAKRWASRYGIKGYLNSYEYTPNYELKYLVFEGMTEEWLDFIVACRSGKPHTYDIVEGPMVDDTIYNYIQNYIDGKISRAAFWELAKFNHPTYQISFHTISALDTLKYVGSEVVDGSKIQRIYDYSDVFHCEPIEKVAMEFIEEYQVQDGNYDNVESCRYKVPDYWDIGEVYERLIEDCYADNEIMKGIWEVYHSWIDALISDYNTDFYYQSRDYIGRLCTL